MTASAATSQSHPPAAPGVAAEASAPLPAIPTTIAGRQWWLLAVGWAVVATFILVFGWHLIVAGIDIRNGFWAYSRPVHERGDVENAFAKGNQVLRDTEKLAQVSKSPGEKTIGQATIANSGPMLFDGPMDLKNLHQHAGESQAGVSGRFSRRGKRPTIESMKACRRMIRAWIIRRCGSW